MVWTNYGCPYIQRQFAVIVTAHTANCSMPFSSVVVDANPYRTVVRMAANEFKLRLKIEWEEMAVVVVLGRGPIRRSFYLTWFAGGKVLDSLLKSWLDFVLVFWGLVEVEVDTKIPQPRQLSIVVVGWVRKKLYWFGVEFGAPRFAFIGSIGIEEFVSAAPT
jgi:hypothetical protein